MTVVEPLDPPGPGLAAKNRRLFAQRENWPDGALDACVAVDRDNPGWYTTWHAGGAGAGSWERPGFYALPRYHRHKPGWAYGASAEEVRHAIDDYPQASI